MKTTGYLLHTGTVSGHEFAAIATLKTANRKTGDMVQVWFILTGLHPVLAVKQGLDARTICSGCPFASGNGCYVNVGQAPSAIYNGHKRGIYPQLEPKDYAAVFGGRKIRFGAYGNPTLLPLSIVKAIATVSAGWTGYFHDWQTNPLAKQYSAYFMASTETQDSYRLATSLGYRTFHVSPDQPADTVECLATSTNGRVQCADCKLACNGLTGRPLSVWIAPHGSRSSRATAAATA